MTHPKNTSMVQIRSRNGYELMAPPCGRDGRKP
jgi:hypothetical protein